jgi:hypothetical protein
LLLAVALLAAPWSARAVRAAAPSDSLVGADSLATPDTLAVADSSAARAPLAAFPPAGVRAWQVGLLRADRMQHMGLSFALTTALIILTRDRGAAAAATVSLGLAKELWDRRGSSGFDPIDLAADAAGIGLAVVLVRARGD